MKIHLLKPTLVELVQLDILEMDLFAMILMNVIQFNQHVIQSQHVKIPLVLTIALLAQVDILEMERVDASQKRVQNPQKLLRLLLLLPLSLELLLYSNSSPNFKLINILLYGFFFFFILI